MQVQRGGVVALIDYGQSKQLPDHLRLAFARVVLALASRTASRDPRPVSAALGGLGVVTEKNDPAIRAKMAAGMFDTLGKARAPPAVCMLLFGGWGRVASGRVSSGGSPAHQSSPPPTHIDARAQVDPFDPDSPIKQSAITTFPADMFFVLRVVQLLRGLATGASPARARCAATRCCVAQKAGRSCRCVRRSLKPSPS